MKLVIENGENISLTESLGVTYELIGNFGLLEIVAECEKADYGVNTYARETKTNTVLVTLILENDALAVRTKRIYNNEQRQ